MNTYTLRPSKWTKGTTVIANGKAMLITSKPKKAINGTWLVFWADTDGKVTSAYLREEDID
jgi:hypothetical protein